MSQAPEFADFYSSAEFFGIQYRLVINDAAGHMIDDPIRDALIVCSTVIEIGDAFIDLQCLTVILV